MADQRKTEFVTVEIHGQSYQLSGQSPEHICALAAMVDERMRLVAGHGQSRDPQRVAVLAALNLADELTMAREQLNHSMRVSHEPPAAPEEVRMGRARIESLSGMLDEVLRIDRRSGS